jgi:uncharacterized protein (TIGR02453 family)
MKGLKDNNNRPWFESHRADWENLKAELQAVCGALEPFLGELDPELETNPKTGRCLGRIFRDIRFARDKSLFRESIDVLFFSSACGRTKAPGFAVGLRADICYIGAWLGASMTGWRKRFEANIAAAPGQFERYLEENGNLGGFRLRSESYKRERVSGLPPLAREWAQRKYFYLADMVPEAETVSLGPEILGRIEGNFLRLYPLYLYATSERIVQDLERFKSKLATRL